MLPGRRVPVSRPAGEALTTISARIFSADLAYIRECFPSGYQVAIRQIVREWVNKRKQENNETMAYLEKQDE